MLRKVLDSDTLPSAIGGEPATSTLNRNRRRHRQTHVESYRRLNKGKTAGKGKRNGPTLLPVHRYSKWLEMRRMHD